MATHRRASIVMAAVALTSCTPDAETATDIADAQPSVREFERHPVSLADSTVLVVHAKRLTVGVPSCNGRPVVQELRETAAEVRIRVITNTDSSDDCLDGVSVPLEEPLGDRTVIDVVSESELRITER